MHTISPLRFVDSLNINSKPMKTIIKSSPRQHWLSPIVVFFTCLLSLISASCDKIETNPDALKSSSVKSTKPKVKQDIVDVDGNIYNTVKIGKQIWMTENLRVTKYNDGTDIPLVTGNPEWMALNSSGYCWFNNDYNTYGSTYGALYNWWVVGTGKLCPTGWHVPTDTEWSQLILYLDPAASQPNSYDPLSWIAGGSLKESGTTHWLAPNEGATDAVGFMGLPASARLGDGRFLDLGYDGHWWTSSEVNNYSAWLYYVSNGNAAVWRIPPAKYIAVSVRCLKD